jgi:hypothetical protein
MLNFNLTPGQVQIRKRAREFALEEILPVAWHYDQKGEFPLCLNSMPRKRPWKLPMKHFRFSAERLHKDVSSGKAAARYSSADYL